MRMTRGRAPYLIALLLLLAPLQVSAVDKAARHPRPYTIEQFMKTESIGGASFSADEKRVLFSSNRTGIFNVYSVPVGGGAATALTDSKTDTTIAVSYFPKDDRFLYTRDNGGNELNHLFVRLADGKERDLTPGEKLKAIFVAWSRDGDAFYVQTNERDARFFDLYRYDAKSFERTMLYQDDKGYNLGAISRDERWLGFQKPNSTADSDLYLWDGKAKEMKLLSKHEGLAAYGPEDFDPESKSLYYTTNDGSEFMRVKRYELESGKHEEVEKADWDVTFTNFSKKGGYRVTGINEDGRTVIRLHDAKTGKEVALPKLPGGEITSVRISNSDARMAFYLNGDRSPSNLYVLEVGKGEPKRLTDTLNKEIDPEDLVESEVVRFESFDKMKIPNILYKPHQASAEAKAPALVWVHGGPGGQTRKGYAATIQYLVNHGYVILGINNRGSGGYGKTFFTADDQKHGKEPLWDCVAGKKYLQSLPYVDRDRIAIIGGSYGGYMVLAALAFQPKEFTAGVDIFGVSNWIRTLQSIPKWWESQRIALYKEMGDPEKQADMLREISPLFHADKIERPLLVLQGANDPRVLKAESDEIVEAVKKKGVPVEYVVFPDEGHGFSKRENQIKGYGKILEFLDKYVKAPALEVPKAADVSRARVEPAISRP